MSEVANKVHFANRRPKVSVIIPVYNIEKYLARCLDSVVGQTERGLEIICVNDGSTNWFAEAIIRKTMADNELEKRLPTIREVKRLLLAKYNLWAQVAALIGNVPESDRLCVGPRTIYSRKVLCLRNPLVALSDGIGHLRQFAQMCFGIIREK